MIAIERKEKGVVMKPDRYKYRKKQKETKKTKRFIQIPKKQKETNKRFIVYIVFWCILSILIADQFGNFFYFDAWYKEMENFNFYNNSKSNDKSGANTSYNREVKTLIFDNNNKSTNSQSKRSIENSLDSCGCPASSCNFWNLMDIVNRSRSKFTCEERLQFLTKRYKTTRIEACKGSAENGYCTLSCHPDFCAPFTPEPFLVYPAIVERAKDTSTKMVHYVLDARPEGQYTTSYDGNQCPENNRPEFPSTLSQPGQLDFSTHVSTNLKILIMGDSVGAHQIGQNFMEAATFNMTQSMYKAITHIKAPATQPNPNNQVSAIATNGGGTAMVYRANAGILSQKLLRNAGMGVSAHHVRDLRRHLHITTGSSSVDVMVMQIPSWIGKEQEIYNAITTETLTESIQLAGEIFGAKTVVLLTVMLSNNLFKDLQGNFFPLQKKIYEFSNYFRNNVNSLLWHGVEQVVVLDLASLSLELVQANAQALGLMKENNGDKGIDSTLQKALLEQFTRKIAGGKKSIQVSVPIVCSEVLSTNATTCTPNRFSVDGMHWCMKNGVGGRIQAGLACLLSCAYPNLKQDVGNISITNCESNCNNRFMNVHALNFGRGGLINSLA
mmetsp:Transcript_13623/g.14694  ORF Transcript_13623/g.14694 Transcript_13623/m.14694 type:complete len:611 (+) Transcript_13623:115-1947(+)